MEDVKLEDIAKAVGTPVYVYSSAQFENNFKAYKHSFEALMPDFPVTICYACKANSNIAVLRTLQRLGAGADIVSSGELSRAREAGIPSERIVFSGVGKSYNELSHALRENIFQINVESLEELELLSKVATDLKTTAPIALRINPDVDAKTHKKITTGKKENKFGIDFDRALEAYQIAASLPGIVPMGLTMHIGSQLLDTAPFKNAFKRMAKLVTLLRDNGHDIQRIDLGGGVGITYSQDDCAFNLNDYVALVRDIIAPLGCHIILEPGRSIAGDAGVLVSETLFVKKGNTREFVILDAAMNDLMRPALYDAYHPIWPCQKSQTDPKTTEYDIVGPVCETGDSFALSEKLPQIRQGDYIALMMSGAYGAVMASTYNTRPLAAEVMVKGGQYSIIRRRWTVEDILKQEQYPSWLDPESKE